MKSILSWTVRTVGDQRVVAEVISSSPLRVQFILSLDGSGAPQLSVNRVRLQLKPKAEGFVGFYEYNGGGAALGKHWDIVARRGVAQLEARVLLARSWAKAISGVVAFLAIALVAAFPLVGWMAVRNPTFVGGLSFLSAAAALALKLWAERRQEVTNAVPLLHALWLPRYELPAGVALMALAAGFSRQLVLVETLDKPMRIEGVTFSPESGMVMWKTSFERLAREALKKNPLLCFRPTDGADIAPMCNNLAGRSGASLIDKREVSCSYALGAGTPNSVPVVEVSDETCKLRPEFAAPPPMGVSTETFCAGVSEARSTPEPGSANAGKCSIEVLRLTEEPAMILHRIADAPGSLTLNRELKSPIDLWMRLPCMVQLLVGASAKGPCTVAIRNTPVDLRIGSIDSSLVLPVPSSSRIEGVTFVLPSNIKTELRRVVRVTAGPKNPATILEFSPSVDPLLRMGLLVVPSGTSIGSPVCSVGLDRRTVACSSDAANSRAGYCDTIECGCSLQSASSCQEPCEWNGACVRACKSIDKKQDCSGKCSWNGRACGKRQGLCNPNLGDCPP